MSPALTLKKKSIFLSRGNLPSNGEAAYWLTGLWLGMTRSLDGS
jgi:hypothetical protein